MEGIRIREFREVGELRRKKRVESEITKDGEVVLEPDMDVISHCSFNEIRLRNEERLESESFRNNLLKSLEEARKALEQQEKDLEK